MRYAAAQILSPDLTLEQARTPIAEIAHFLQETLGQRLTAYAIGISDGRDIGKYARGLRSPNPNTQKSLRDLNYIVRMLISKEDKVTIQNWMVGMNSILNDRSPANYLRDGTEDHLRQVVEAAKKFSRPRLACS